MSTAGEHGVLTSIWVRQNREARRSTRCYVKRTAGKISEGDPINTESNDTEYIAPRPPHPSCNQVKTMTKGPSLSRQRLIWTLMILLKP